MTTTTTEMQAVEMLNGFFNEYESKSGVAHVDKGFTALVGMHYGNGYKVVAIERCYNTVDEAIEAVRYFADKADNEFKHNNYGRVDSGVGRNRKEYFKLGYKGYQLLTAEYFNAIIDEYAVSEAAMEVAIEAEEANAASNMTDIEKVIAERKTMTVRELFLEAKKEVGYDLNARGAKMWFISYPRYDINTEEYIGHTMPLKRTSKDVEIYLREEYCGMTLKTFLAEEKAWIDQETDKAIRQMNIDDEAEHISDKVAREVKACDDNDEVFNLLPSVDELNDVDESAVETVGFAYNTKLIQDNPCSKFKQFYIGDAENYKEELITFDADRWTSIKSAYYGAEIYNGTDNKIHFRVGKFFDDASGEWVSGPGKIITNADEFFRIMSERGACTIDETPTVNPDEYAITQEAFDYAVRIEEYRNWRRERDEREAYDRKRKERGARNQLLRRLNEKLSAPDIQAGIRKMGGKNQCRGLTGTYILDHELRVTPANDERRFMFKVSTLPLARYDTPAQVDKVIDLLREAIERGDKEFIFPTIDELKPPTVEEIFAELPADPNADNYRMARYITYAHSDGTNYAIRSTDFLRAEKALALLKAALTKQIGEYKFGIDFYPIEFDAKKIVTVYHAEELDGSEEDEETFTVDVMPVEDGDDDELIDAAEKDLSTLKYFDNVRLIRSKWGEVWEVYELRDVRKYRSRGSKRVELCQRGRNERWWTISPKELTLRLDEYGLTIADLKPYVESRGRVIA